MTRKISIPLPNEVDDAHFRETGQIRALVVCSAEQLASIMREYLPHITGKIRDIRANEEAKLLVVEFET